MRDPPRSPTQKLASVCFTYATIKPKQDLLQGNKFQKFAQFLRLQETKISFSFFFLFQKLRLIKWRNVEPPVGNLAL